MHPILSSPCVCLCFFVCTITFRTKCIKFHCIYHLVDVRNSFCLQQQQWQCQPLQNNERTENLCNKLALSKQMLFS